MAAKRPRRWLPAVGAAAVLAAVALLAFFLAGRRPIVRVGVSLPLSGPKKESGEQMLKALRLAAAAERAQLVVRDDANDPDKARANARAFAADPTILSALGHYDEGPAAAAAKVYDQAGLPAFFPTIGEPSVTGRSRWGFLGTYSEAEEAQTMAAYLRELKNSRAAVVAHGDDGYGRNAAAAFEAKAERLGMSVVDVSYREDGSPLPADFVAKRLAGPAAKADCVVLFSHSVNGAALIKQLRAAGLKLDVYGGSRLATGLIPMLGKDTDDVHLAFPFMFSLASLRTHAFQQAYLHKYREEPSLFGSFAYDGLSLIAEGARRDASREGIRRYLASLDSEKTEVDGISGPLRFDADQRLRRDVTMATIRYGAFTPSFVQLKAVTTAHALSVLPDLLRSGEVVVSDGKPYHKIQVVYAGIDFYKVPQADFHQPTYDLEFFFWLKWRGDFDPENVVFLNEVEGAGQRAELRRNFGAKGKPDPKVKWIVYKVKGTFVADYDLRLFPFDRQRLGVSVAHRSQNARKLLLVADSAQESAKSLKSMPHDWLYLGREGYAGTFNYDSSFGNPTYRPDETQSDYSTYRADILARRRIFPFLITLFLPLAVLIAISLCGLFVPISDYWSRTTFVLTSLLGVLVEHMTQARSMPQVGYLMRADYFYVAAYVLYFILTAEITFVNVLYVKEKTELAERIDKPFMWAFGIGTILVYAALALSAWLSAA